MPIIEGHNTTIKGNKSVQVTDDNRLKTSNVDEMELYGASIATRPLATAVPVGTVFVVVANPLVVYMSDGTNWVEVA